MRYRWTPTKNTSGPRFRTATTRDWAETSVGADYPTPVSLSRTGPGLGVLSGGGASGSCLDGTDVYTYYQPAQSAHPGLRTVFSILCNYPYLFYYISLHFINHKYYSTVLCCFIFITSISDEMLLHPNMAIRTQLHDYRWLPNEVST